MATEDRGGHRPALDRRDGEAAARQQPEQAVPDPETRAQQLGHLTIRSMDADDTEGKAGDREGTDGPEHDQTDVERRPAHVVRRSRQQVEAGAQQAAGGLHGRGRELGLERQLRRLRIGSGLSPSRLGIGFRRQRDRWLVIG